MINFIVCDNEKAIVDSVKSLVTKVMFKTNIEYKIHQFYKYDKKFNEIINSDLENKIYILDIEVEDVSGLDVAKKVRNKDWNSVILILTAHNELEYVAYKSKLLLFDFISKFDLYENQMVDAITLCVERVISTDKLIIKVEDKVLDKLPSGKMLPSVLGKSYGINKNYDLVTFNNIESYNVYYTASYNDNEYNHV